MQLIDLPGFLGDYYVVVETDDYVIVREVQNDDNVDDWGDLWIVADLNKKNWDESSKRYSYMFAETFELALTCAKGIVQGVKDAKVAEASSL